MPTTKAIRGEMRQFDVPDWQPLEALVGEEVAEAFMWMGDVELSDGRILNVYKHWHTRRSMHLGPDLIAHGYLGEGRYTPMPALELLRLVFAGWSRCARDDGPVVTIDIEPGREGPD